MKRSGFTLIELLVTISIIAVLSAIAFATYQGIQSKARDSVRKNDLNKLATALEIYFQRNDQYVAPVTGDNDTLCQSVNDNFYATIAPSSGNAPKDPSTNNPYCYLSISKGQAFRLFAKLENCNGSGGNLCGFTNYNYTVVSDDLTIAAAPGDTAP